MPFVQEAKAHVKTLAPGCVERLILEFLLQHGVGRHSAQVWSAVEQHLHEHGHTIRQQTFQQGLLKQSREGAIFIGSNDHGDSRGYFLIQDKEDAEVMRRWYRRRIEVEKAHLAQLGRLIETHFGA